MFYGVLIVRRGEEVTFRILNIFVLILLPQWKATSFVRPWIPFNKLEESTFAQQIIIPGGLLPNPRGTTTPQSSHLVISPQQVKAPWAAHIWSVAVRRGRAKAGAGAADQPELEQRVRGDRQVAAMGACEGDPGRRINLGL